MKVIKLKEIDSTNLYAMKNIEELEDRTLISADFQTCGRGRFQRKWIGDYSGNIYATFVLKPEKIENAATLTQYLSVVLCRVLVQYGVFPEIKWPNDVLVQGGKISGILCESSVRGGSVKGYVLGIGVNLNMSLEEINKIDIPAVSLNRILNQEVDKEEFQNKLYKEFFKNYETILLKGFESIREEYKKKCGFLGKNIYISNYSGEKSPCKAIDISDDGSLWILNAQGKKELVRTADVCF